MFTALVTFLVTITMILGGAGSPVDVILDNLSIDLAAALNANPHPEGEVAPYGYLVSTGQEEGFAPPPDAGIVDPDPPDPVRNNNNNDVLDPLPDPERVQNLTRERTRECDLGTTCNRYQGTKQDETEETELEMIGEDPIDQKVIPGNGPQGGTGKDEGFVPAPDPNPLPDPNPAPAPASESDKVPAPVPDPAPAPAPAPDPAFGDPEPAPAQTCEGGNCTDPLPVPPANDGGDGNGDCLGDCSCGCDCSCDGDGDGNKNGKVTPP